MKKIFFAFFVAAIAMVGCSKHQKFNVMLMVDNAENKTAYLMKNVDWMDVCIDSAIIKDGKAELSAPYDDPQMLYKIKFGKDDQCGVVPFFSENNDMTIIGDPQDMAGWKVIGCKTMEELVAHHEESMELYENNIMTLFDQMTEASLAEDTIKLAEIQTEFQTLLDEYHTYQVDYIRSHSDSYISHYLLEQYMYELESSVVRELLASFTSESVFRTHIEQYLNDTTL